MAMLRCDACVLRRRTLFVPFTDEELAFMLRFKVGEQTVPRGATVLREGSTSPQLYTVLAGMGVRYKTLENGRRQVVNFVFPGDFIGIQAGIMGEMQHSVESSSDMTLCVFQRSDLWDLFRDNPQRAFDLTWIAAVEENFLGEVITTLGQRDATQRIAWALVRIHERLAAVGLATENAVPLPFRQQDLADALGLSLVHTNKTIIRLRDRGMLRWNNGILHVPDRAGLAQIAMIDLERPEVRPLL